MIIFDTPRPVNFRHFTTTAHCSSTLLGEEATQELLAFGRDIGLRESWLQHRGDPKEHFDLFDSKIGRARQWGATEVNPREWLRRCVWPKRATPENPTGRLMGSVLHDGVPKRGTEEDAE